MSNMGKVAHSPKGKFREGSSANLGEVPPGPADQEKYTQEEVNAMIDWEPKTVGPSSGASSEETVGKIEASLTSAFNQMKVNHPQHQPAHHAPNLASAAAPAPAKGYQHQGYQQSAQAGGYH